MIIYKATNIINNKIYIGQTVNTLEHRKNQHFNEAFNLRRKLVYFHEAIRKYGKDAFVFEVIEEIDNIDELNKRESYWISFYKSTDKKFGYNLDSGGKNCKKSHETKAKIGITTSKKWKNAETAEKMLNGLRKGTEKWKEVSKDRRVKLVCPICDKEFLVPKYLAKRRTYCSYECAKIGNYETSRNNFKLATQKNIEIKNNRNKKVLDIIYLWCINNKDLVLNCPKNKISTNFSELKSIVKNEVGVNDWRTICDSVNAKSKKDFLDILKKYIHENIC